MLDVCDADALGRGPVAGARRRARDRAQLEREPRDEPDVGTLLAERGFTVFIERKIMHQLYGKSVFDFNAIGGLMELKETVDRLGATHHAHGAHAHARGRRRP